jgi:hypothetical protein
LKFTLQASQRLANANLARGASVAVGVGMIVKNEYRIEPIGAEFRVIDCEGVQVGSFPTEEGARQDMERCEKETAMLDTAKLLVDIAVKTHVLIHGVDHETAL